MSRARNPQAKKRLSLQRDRRNMYGENDKSSRKNIPRAQSRAGRGNRRADTTDLNAVRGTPDRAVDDAAGQRLLGRRKKIWRRHPESRSDSSWLVDEASILDE